MHKNAPFCTDACNTPVYYTTVSVHPRRVPPKRFPSILVFAPTLALRSLLTLNLVKSILFLRLNSPLNDLFKFKVSSRFFGRSTFMRLNLKKQPSGNTPCYVGKVTNVRSRPGKPQESPRQTKNQRKGQNEKFMNFAHFCEFWCFSLGKTSTIHIELLFRNAPGKSS